MVMVVVRWPWVHTAAATVTSYCRPAWILAGSAASVPPFLPAFRHAPDRLCSPLIFQNSGLVWFREPRRREGGGQVTIDDAAVKGARTSPGVGWAPCLTYFHPSSSTHPHTHTHTHTHTARAAFRPPLPPAEKSARKGFVPCRDPDNESGGRVRVLRTLLPRDHTQGQFCPETAYLLGFHSRWVSVQQCEVGHRSVLCAVTRVYPQLGEMVKFKWRIFGTFPAKFAAESFAWSAFKTGMARAVWTACLRAVRCSRAALPR